MSFPSDTSCGFRAILLEWCGLAFLLVFICFLAWPGMNSPLLLDDFRQMTHVEGLRSWKDFFGPDAFGLFRPLKNLVFHALRGMSLFQGHALTLVAYLAATVGVYVLFRRILDSARWAFVAVILWATAPTQVSTAVWLSALNLSVAMALACACLVCHDASQGNPARSIRMAVLSCVCLFFAQVAYETAVALPALCLLVDGSRKRDLFSRSSLWRYCALGGVTLLYLAIRSLSGAVHLSQAKSGFDPEMRAWQLSLSAPWFLWKHFMMWLFPLGRIEFASSYIFGVSATRMELIAAWVWLVILIGLAIGLWRRLRLVSVGLLWFLAASFPSSNLIPVWSGPIEDYYLFFPSIGLILALVGAARAWTARAQGKNSLFGIRSRNACVVTLVLLGGWRLAYVPFFRLQADLWNKPVELYLRAEASRSDQFLLQALAAAELKLSGDLEHSRILAQKSHDSGPWYPASSYILGCLCFEGGEYAEAETWLRECLGILTANDLGRDHVVFQLGRAIHSRGAPPEGLKEILLPLLENRQSPNHLEAVLMLIDSYVSFGRLNDAKRALQKALRLYPNHPELMQRSRHIAKRMVPGTDLQSGGSDE